MKNGIYKILCLLLSFVILFSVCVVSASANSSQQTPTYEYYVSPNGDDKNDGSLENPLATVDKAVELANNKGATTGNTINVYLKDATESYAQFSTDCDTELSNATVVIQPYGEGIAKLYLPKDGTKTTRLYADTVFKSISLKNDGTWLHAVHHNVTFDENCVLEGAASIATGNYVDSENAYNAYSRDVQKLILQNKFSNNEVVAFPSGVKADAITYSNKIDITIDNPENSIRVRLGQASGSSVTLGEVGVLSYNVVSANSITFQAGSYKPIVNGTFQAVINADTINGKDALNSLSWGADSKKWVVFNETGFDGLITATEEVGTIKIADGYKVTLSNGTDTLDNQEGTVTLQEGTWNVTAYQKDSNNTDYKYYVSPGGDDRNDGSLENPLATVDKAVELANNAGATTGNTINVYLKDATESYAQFSTDCDTELSNATVVIQPYGEGVAKLYLPKDTTNSNKTTRLYADTVFKSISLKNDGEWLHAVHHNVTFDENCVLEGAASVATGNRTDNADGYDKYSKEVQELILKNKFSDNEVVAFPSGKDARAVTYTNRINITIDNPENSIRVRLGQASGSSVTLGEVGVLSYNVVSANSITFQAGSYKPIVNGTFQAVINADTINGKDALNSLSWGADSKKWVVFNEKGFDGLITATEEVGTIKIADGYKVTLSNGTDTLDNQEGTVTLQEGTWNVTAYQKDSNNTDYKYYVSPGGDDRNDGSLENPLATVDKAVALANDAGANVGNTINVYLKDATESYVQFSSDCDTETSKATVVIQPYGEGIAKLYLPKDATKTTRLYADTVFKSISLKNDGAWLHAVHHNVTFDENCVLEGASSIAIGNYYDTQAVYNSYKKDIQKLVLKNKFSDNEVVAFPSGLNAEAFTYENKIDYTIDNPENSIRVRLGQANGSSVTLGETGTLSYNILSAKSITFQAGNKKPIINGTFQAVINADEIKEKSVLDSLTWGANSKKWIVFNETGLDRLVAATDVLGEFLIDAPNGYDVFAVCGDKIVYPDDNNILKLEQGTWEISYKAKTFHLQAPANVIDTFMHEIPIDKMELGEQYTVSFQHEYLSGALNENVYFCVFGANNGLKRNWTDVIYSSSALGEGFELPEALSDTTDAIRELSFEVLDTDPRFTFTIDQKKYDKYYIGFYFAGTEKPVDLYVSGLTLYKTSDSSKKSLLECNSVNCNMTHWHSSYSNGTTKDKFGDHTLVEYDSQTFADKTGNVKTMLRVAYTPDKNQKLYLIVDPNTLEPNVEYVLSFNSRFTSRVMNDGVSFNFIRAYFDEYGKRRTFRVFGSNIGANFNRGHYTDENVSEFKFQLAKWIFEQSDVFYVGLAFDDGEADAMGYLGNLVIYRADDPTKTNLLDKDLYSTKMDGWATDSIHAGTTQVPRPSIFNYCYYIPHDDRIFDKAISATGDYKSGDRLVAKISKDQLIAGKEYALTVNYNFGIPKLDKDISVALFGDKNANDNVYADTVIFSGKDGTFASSSAGKSDITYKFKMTKEILNKYEDFYIGLYFVNDVKNADIHIADLALYDTVNPNEKLFEQQRYPMDMKGWYTSNSNIALDGSDNIRYEYYESRVFPKYTFVEINDGEWWSDEDVADGTNVDTATINGKVSFTSGECVPNVKVTIFSNIGEYTVKTDKNGVFLFTDIPVGIYNLYITDADGKRFDSPDFIVPDKDSIITLDIVLNKSEIIVDTYTPVESNDHVGTFKGNVYTADLKPVVNLKIILRGFGETVTNAEGYFEFNNVPAGEYEVYTVLGNGEEYIFKTIEVIENVELASKLKYDPVKTISTTDEGSNITTIIIIISIIVVVLIVTGVTVLLVWRKKHKA